MLPDVELPRFMAELRQQESTAARALEFAILTAARIPDVLAAEWSEFDLDAKAWLIPASRRKDGRPHAVPLSSAALAILDGLPRDRFVFGGDALPSDTAIREALRRMGRGDVAIHDFRATFRDWAERSGVAAYQWRTHLWPQRPKLMMDS